MGMNTTNANAAGKSIETIIAAVRAAQAEYDRTHTHKGETIARLREAFRLITPAGNWKERIRAWVPLSDLSACIKAAEYFAGSPLYHRGERETDAGVEVLVEGPGYYACIGA